MSGGFGRSQSLSINTGATNSLFSSQQSQAPSAGTLGGGSLFGNNNATSQPQQGASLFGNAQTQQTQQTQQPAAGNSLFGGTATQQPQSSAPSLFGSASGATAGSTQPTQQSSGSLFGGLGQQQQQQPQAGASLFGGQNQQQNAGTSLFGGLGQKPAAQPAAPSLFSNLNSNTQTAQPQQQQAAPSLFSSLGSNTQSTAAQSSLFGGGTSALGSNSALAGGLRLGRGTTQATVPGVKIDLGAMRGTTRFNDLHPDVQKELEIIDSFIAQQVSFYEQCAALMPGHGASTLTIPPDVHYINSRVDAVELALDNDGAAIQGLKSVLKGDADDARAVFKHAEMAKLPKQYNRPGLIPTSMEAADSAKAASDGRHNHSSAARTDPTDSDAPVDLVSYFSRRADDLGTKLSLYSNHIQEIEQHLSMVEANSLQESEAQVAARRGMEKRGKEDGLKELANTLRDFEDAVLRVAGNVGVAREKLVEASVGREGYGR